MTSSNNIQQLVECFDDIPQMMASMNRINKSIPSCYPDVSQSSSVDAALRAYNPINASDPANQHRVNRMANQAIKVLEQLSKIPVPLNDSRGRHKLNQKQQQHSNNRSIQETSGIVKNKLNMLKETGVDLTKFYSQYDVNRSGKLSYKDFTNTLLAVSAGVKREEALELATKLDAKRTGSIAYSNILNSLQEIESKSIKSESTDSLTTTESYDSERLKSAIKPNTSFSYIDSKSKDANNKGLNNNLSETREIIGYHNLSPEKQVVVNNLTTSISEFSTDFPMTGRRLYHNPSSVRKSVTQTAPYYLDDSLDQLKQRRQGDRPRSSSAPATSRKIGNSDKISNEKQNNLRNALLRKSGESSGELKPPNNHKTKKEDNSSTKIINRFLRDDASELLNIHTKFQQISASPSKKKYCISKRGTSHHNLNTYHEILPTGVLENAVVSDVGGRIGILRHTLKQQDKSKSGLISSAEFKSALYKVGVNLDSEQMTDLFNILSKDAKPYATSTNWYNSGKYIEIESFVERIKSRTESPAFTHLTGKGTANDISAVSEQVEDIRVMKKVLHATNKSSDPTRTFNDVTCKNDNSGINLNQLQDSLSRLGANLSQTEFSSLLKNIETNVSNEKKINLDQFAHLVEKKVNEYDKKSRESKNIHLKSPKYGQSFSSSQVNYIFDNSEYDGWTTSSQAFKNNRKTWERLQDRLQCDSDKVLKAFVGKEGNHSDKRNEEIPLAKLRNNLVNEGVFLPNEDINKLEQHIKEYNNSNSISLENFCNITGISISVDKKDNLVLQHPREIESDKGIFSSASRSLWSNPTMSSSYLFNTVEESNRWIGGEKRKRVPQRNHLHSSDPSKFWEMSHSSETVLFPQPMRSLRDPLPPKQKISATHHHQPQQPSNVSTPNTDVRLVRAVGGLFDNNRQQQQDDFSSNTRNPRDSSSFSRSTGSSKRRSSSAPPIRSNADVRDYFDSGYKTATNSANSSISKWSNLAGYLDSKNPSVSSVNSNNPTPLLEYRGLQSSDSKNNNIVTSYSLLRRGSYASQYKTSEPPFAIDYK